MGDWFHKLAESVPALTAGAAGGMVRWLALKEGVWDGIASVIIGALTAVYAGPLASAITNPFLAGMIIDEARRDALNGFLIGCGGILVVGYILDKWRSMSTRRKGNSDAE